MRTIIIEGVHINLDHEVFEAKSLDSLKKNANLFSHFTEEQREKAYSELWKILHPESEVKKIKAQKSESELE